jgi:hypothetical protein
MLVHTVSQRSSTPARQPDNALVTVVAVLVGAALLGIVGALVAIPAAAALLLLTREMLVPRLDRT